MVDWADHKEVVAQLNARIVYSRQEAEEWRTEAMRLRIVKCESIMLDILSMALLPK